MFLPADYKAPNSQNNYMKLAEGENKFRILTSPVLGWEDWQDKTPVRFRFNEKPLTSIDPKKPVRHFWAFVVWNYKEERIQILHLTQATVRKAIETLSKDADWGAPYFYDIKIFKTGKDKETEYTVNPLPHKELHSFIVEQFNEKPCFLDALFTSSDPFDAKWAQRTPGVFSKSDSIKQPELITKETCITVEQMILLKDWIFADENSDEAMKALLQKCGASSIDKIAPEKFDKAFEWAKNRVELQKLKNEVPF